MIVVHIGMPKAGSTTIQRFLRDNEDALRQRSIDYPTVGRENPNHGLNHRNFANQILGRDKRIHRKSGCLSDLAEHLRVTDYATTILSSEELCRCRDPSIEELRALLAPFGREVRIVLIIRDLIDLIPSAYAQSIRYGANTGDFDAFFDRRENNPVLDQFNVAERWAKAFGWQAIRARPLERDVSRPNRLDAQSGADTKGRDLDSDVSLRPRRALGGSAHLRGDLITDFMACAGVDLAASGPDALPRPPRANEAVGWKTLEAVRGLVAGKSGLDTSHPLMRTQLPPAPGVRKIFGYAAEDAGAEIGWTRDRGCYLTREQARSLIETFTLNVTELNRRLEDKLPPPRSLEERGFVERQFLPDVRHIDRAELRAFYDAWAKRFEERRRARRRERKNAASPPSG